MQKQYLVLDFETRSEVDLRKCGAAVYARHPSTQVLCAAWKLGPLCELRETPTRVWSPFFSPIPRELLQTLFDPTVICVAHNAMFEQLIAPIVFFHGGDTVYNPDCCDPTRWICTASLAAACALPRKLEEACNALGLSVRKDMEGHRLMLKLSKPRKPTKNNKAKWHTKKSDLNRLMRYCATDVDASTELLLSLPPLNPKERRIWELDQTINHRGFCVDSAAVSKALGLIQEETARLNQETKNLTIGEVGSTRQRDATLGWLNRGGLGLPNLQAKTVEMALASISAEAMPLARRVLEIRQSISKSSTAKYQKLAHQMADDGKIRDQLFYHGASTGRWTGRGVQVQNFPRAAHKDIELAIETLAAGDLEWIGLVYGDPMEFLSRCLRNMIVAPAGYSFYCGDYASIETRVLFWVAGHERGLKHYRRHADLYREMAAMIYRIPLDEVTKAQREVGKRAILGCGYGMGHKKFWATCNQYGQEVSPELARAAVVAYRTLHYPVPDLWNEIQRAAIYATLNPQTRVTINHTKWSLAKDFLWCELPSKRMLAYYKPTVRYELTPWGERAPKLYHWSVNPKTKKWENAATYGGKLTENVVQAIARDIMAEAMLRLEKAGFEVVLSVHDELLTQARSGPSFDLEEFTQLMAETPGWGTEIPIEVEGWTGARYRKG